MKKATVIGAGLAGCEASLVLANKGISVDLIEMKPKKMSPAHHSENFCELVCSNSLRGAFIHTAPGLLKEELRRLGSVVIECADKTSVPAGGALAVDREGFAALVTERIKANKLINIIEQEVLNIPDIENLIIATGPLTTDSLGADIKRILGDEDYLHFYDAAAPIISKDSIDMSKAYLASRYDKGTPDYINCPMDKEQYEIFHRALVNAQDAPVHGFEDLKVFEGCMPVEVMARRGVQTLLYGPLKPVGLRNPQTGITPHAVVQLRLDNASGSMYNIVGFQTHLKWGEQKRVFALIPGLENAEFLRYGVMHRNTFINSPKVLDKYYHFKNNIYFAGQITGVEGYIESIASGFTAGESLANKILGKNQVEYTDETAIGALGLYVSNKSIEKFEPMNINFGIIKALDYRVRGKQEKNTVIANRALDIIDKIVKQEAL